jgi:tetratricopeptide (TPR) repeat protein
MADDLYIEDVHHLSAAKGWIELGNHVEAYHELEKICPGNRVVPDVLAVRWQIYTLAGRHDSALPVAEALVKAAPDRYPGYIWRAHSLNELGRTSEAVEALLPAARKFPTLGIIPFQIACYHAALGQLHDAKTWLQCAFASPEADSLKLKALDDPKLKELWDKIGAL